MEISWFCIIQILREINFKDSWSAKSAILPHLTALNCDFCEFMHFLKGVIYQMNKIHTHKKVKMAKTAIFAFLGPTKLISRKISLIQKIMNLPHYNSEICTFYYFPSSLCLQEWLKWSQMTSVLSRVLLIFRNERWWW